MIWLNFTGSLIDKRLTPTVVFELAASEAKWKYDDNLSRYHISNSNDSLGIYVRG